MKCRCIIIFPAFDNLTGYIGRCLISPAWDCTCEMQLNQLTRPQTITHLLDNTIQIDPESSGICGTDIFDFHTNAIGRISIHTVTLPPFHFEIHGGDDQIGL